MDDQMTTKTGKLDRIIVDLENLQSDAQDLIDAHVDRLASKYPQGTSWGVIKCREIAEPAGSTLDLVAALRLVKEQIKK
jgi:hypothetical protein